MIDSEYMKLQNGSDVRGVASEGIPGQHVNLTSQRVESIAKAFAAWLSDKTKGKDKLKISVGMDSRISGPALKAAAIDGLLSAGCSVLDCGMASTPAMFMSTVMDGFECDGAIMITASHLPFNRNGMKFFTRGGGLEKEEITDILNKASQNKSNEPKTAGSVKTAELIRAYAKRLRDKIMQETGAEKPLDGFKIIVDAGNGAGGFFKNEVLEPLGADTCGSQFTEPDGHFPNHIPNPENKDAMDSISSAVVKNGADLGIIFDADVDRAGAVLKGGKEINRNALIALMSAIVLDEHPRSIIVTDSVTSTGLKKFIEALGGIHHRFKRGYKNVIDEAIRLNKEGKGCYLAMETSGHGALYENYFLDDGAYLMTKIIIKMANLKKTGKSIESLISMLPEPKEAKEFRMNLNCEDFKEYGMKIIDDLHEYAKRMDWDIAPDNYEGIRVSFDKENGDGWFLLRMSLHEPLMPLNIESDSKGGVNIIASKVYEFLRRYRYLDTKILAGDSSASSHA